MAGFACGFAQSGATKSEAHLDPKLPKLFLAGPLLWAQGFLSLLLNRRRKSNAKADDGEPARWRVEVPVRYAADSGLIVPTAAANNAAQSQGRTYRVCL